MHSWILYLHLINSSREWRTALKLDNSGLLPELEHSGCGQGLIDIFPFQRWFLLDFFFLSAWFLLPLFMVFFVKSLIEARYLYHSISQLEQISLVMRSSLVFCLLFCISCGIHVQGQEALSLSLEKINHPCFLLTC